MATVSLYLRTTEEGKRVYRLADTRKQADEGVYFLRYDLGGKRYWRAAGDSLKLALVAVKTKELSLLKGEEKAPEPRNTAPEKLTLADQREKFLEYKKGTKKRDRTPLDSETLDAYAAQTAEFLSVCSGEYAEEITGEDLRAYMDALERRGLQQRSVCNHYTAIACFLKFCGIDHKPLLDKDQRPRPDDGVPEEYTPEEMKAFFGAIEDERQCLAFELLLKTGLRMREMATLETDDFHLGKDPTVTVQARKPHLNFRTKTGKSRVVPLEKGLALKLKSWRDRNIGKRLVFGTDKGKEDRHWHRYCQQIAKKAGLNTKKFWVHKFRDTYATWGCRSGKIDLRTLQHFLGHASILMTEKYLAPAQGKYAQAAVNAAFGGFLVASI
jgi:integrase/recombinase XerD